MLYPIKPFDRAHVKGPIQSNNPSLDGLKNKQIMIKQKLTICCALAALLTFCLASCKKDQNNDYTASTNEAISSLVNKSVQEDVDAATLHRSANSSCDWQALLPDCATVTESGEDYPIEIIIDYGDGCEDNFGRIKSGQVIITLTGEMLDEGSSRTVTFSAFSVNDIDVAGTRVVTNIGTSDDGFPQFSRDVDMSLTHEGNTFSRSFDGTATWLSGYETAECGDNVFELEGSGSCTRPNGAVVTRTIIEPLLIDRVCGYIIAGYVEVEAPMGTRSIDFGDGECDSMATVTGPDGQTFEIDLDNPGGPNPG